VSGRARRKIMRIYEAAQRSLCACLQRPEDLSTVPFMSIPMSRCVVVVVVKRAVTGDGCVRYRRPDEQDKNRRSLAPSPPGRYITMLLRSAASSRSIANANYHGGKVNTFETNRRLEYARGRYGSWILTCVHSLAKPETARSLRCLVARCATYKTLLLLDWSMGAPAC